MRSYCPKRIRDRRLAKGITQQELADKIGTSRIYINEIERGKKVPRATMLARIAKALNVRESYFFVNDVSNN